MVDKAIENYDNEYLKNYFENNPGIIETMDLRPETITMSLAKVGNLEMFDYVVSLGADPFLSSNIVFFEDYYGIVNKLKNRFETNINSFFVASYYGNISIIKSYFDQIRESINFLQIFIDIFTVSIERENIDIVEYFFNKDLIISEEIKEIFIFCFEIALTKNNFNLVRPFLKDFSFNNMIHIAAENHCVELLPHLMIYNDINSLNYSGKTPLMLAITTNNFLKGEKAIMFLIENSNCNTKGDKGETALMYYKHLSSKCSSRLLELSDLSIRNDNDETFVTMLIGSNNFRNFMEVISLPSVDIEHTLNYIKNNNIDQKYLQKVEETF